MKTRGAALALLLTLGFVLVWTPPAISGEKPFKLIHEMKGADVLVVPPRSVHINGEGKATVRHHPLQGYDNDAYPALFGALAEKILGKGPTRWNAAHVIPDEGFYFQVETSDPDGEPAETIAQIPQELTGHDYLAIVRYAEFAYGVTSRPHFTQDNKVVIEHLVFLTLDVQLAIYDGSTGEVVGVFDAERKVEVPEIQAQTTRAKAYYRSTVGGLQEMKKSIRKGERAP